MYRHWGKKKTKEDKGAMSGAGDIVTEEAKQVPVPHTITESKYDRTLFLNGWSIRTSKRPISNSKEIDAMSDALTIPVPEMIFGNNLVRVSHESLGIDIRWTAFDALDRVDKTGTALKVSYSDSWNRTRDEHTEDIKHVTKPFDWTYTTPYCGTLLSTNNEECTARRRKEWRETEELLPMELLKRQDPILFYDEVILYESELDDNGTSLLSVRVRVMPERLLILGRFFMRLDDVIFRVRDTRVYVEFNTGKVLREYLEREETYENVKNRVRKFEMDRVGELLNDANWVTQQCPIINGKMETVS